MLRGFLFWHCAPWIASSAYPERVGVPVVPSGQEARVSDGRTEGITGKNSAGDDKGRRVWSLNLFLRSMQTLDY